MVKTHDKNQKPRCWYGVHLLRRLLPRALSRNHRFFFSGMDGLPGSGRDFRLPGEISVAPVPLGAGSGSARSVLSVCRCAVYLFAVATFLSIGGAYAGRI